MKALYVVHYPVFGGPHNQILQTHAHLSELGWDTTVVLPDEPGNAVDRLKQGGVKVVPTKLHRLRNSLSPLAQGRFLAEMRFDIARIQRLLQAEEADLVVIGGLTNPHAAFAAKREDVALCWQLLDISSPPPLLRLMSREVVRRADSVLVTGHELVGAHPGLGKVEERIFEYFPPVNLDLFTPAPSARAAARIRLGLDDSDVVVGSVSNINPDKDQLAFTRAAIELRRTNPEVKFILLGARYPQHEKYAHRIEDLARSAGLSEIDFSIIDPGAEVPLFAAALDVFWLTSRAEGLPTVIGESMALGVPVIASRVGSVPSAVVERRNGFLFNSGDHEQLAKLTTSILNNPIQLTRLREGARKFAEEHFDARRTAKTFARAFDFAVARHGRSHH